jgi:hypothetical protein
MDFVYTGEDGVLSPPPPSTVAEDITSDVNTLTWSKTLNMDGVNQEFEDFNPNTFYQFLKNKYQDEWPDGPEDPSYRIDDAWKLSMGITPVYTNGTANGTANVNPFSNINNSTLTSNYSSININNQRSSNSTIDDDIGFSWDEPGVRRENLNKDQTNSNPYVDGDNGIPDWMNRVFGLNDSIFTTPQNTATTRAAPNTKTAKSAAQVNAIIRTIKKAFTYESQVRPMENPEVHSEYNIQFFEGLILVP